VNKKYLLAVAALAILGGLALLFARMPARDPAVSSYGPLHWHPQLRIFARGEPIAIPENVGIGPTYREHPGFDFSMGMVPMHTHTDLPNIHLEFSRSARPEELTLGRFFEVWGKDMRSFGQNLRMTVNGTANTEYESYIMRDGDVIELHYE
jgi:hypothetical protein